MDILVNGSPLAIEAKPGATLAEVLAQADDLIEKGGSIIVGIKIDGVEIDAAGYAKATARSAEGPCSVEISAESGREVRIRTIGTFLELLALASKAAEEGRTGAGDWRTLREGAIEIRDAFAGLFPADELSFVKRFAETLEASLAGGKAEPDATARASIASEARRSASVFGERLAELRDPVSEMRAASSLFEARAEELADLPVLLQTGKEDKAMKTVLYFIEVFNKVIRVIPELKQAGMDLDTLKIDGQGLAEFYGSFNAVLRELTGAFEHKDAVLIGDLAEYEVLPRMRSFFAAMDGALPS